MGFKNVFTSLFPAVSYVIQHAANITLQYVGTVQYFFKSSLACELEQYCCTSAVNIWGVFNTDTSA